MAYIGNRPFALTVAEGLVSNTTAVHQFGRAPDGVQTSATDIWSRADATPTQQIFVAPTQARTHTIASTSTDDDSDAGAGARTMRIWGLTSWSAAEVTEDVNLDGAGTNNVQTANSYVIINRMKVLTSGTTSVNVGVITATANTDSTVSAVILAGQGQTQMAIYGVPSTQTFYLTNFEGSINDNTAQTRVDLLMMVNETPSTSELNVNFIHKHNVQLQNSGSSFIEMNFDPYFSISGPAIIKLQGIANIADVDTYAGFDGYLVTN